MDKNTIRTNRAQNATAFYVRSQLGEFFNEQSLEEHVIDLLTDLNHLAALKNIDFESCLRATKENFDEEKTQVTEKNEGPCDEYNLSLLCPVCCGYKEIRK